ncbi:MAG: serine aminopeptidase domain-containing protein, partial [Bdellovibrionota bacterium]
MILHFTIVALSGFLAWAAPSSQYSPNDIEALRNTPYFHYFDADDKTKLAYSVISDPKATATKGPLVLVEGKGESAYRYVEFAQELQSKGWGPIYILDHRGQGYSEKVLKNSLHVTSFDTYVQDFIKFMDGPVL